MFYSKLEVRVGQCTRTRPRYMNGFHRSSGQCTQPPGSTHARQKWSSCRSEGPPSDCGQLARTPTRLSGNGKPMPKSRMLLGWARPVGESNIFGEPGFPGSLYPAGPLPSRGEMLDRSAFIKGNAGQIRNLGESFANKEFLYGEALSPSVGGSVLGPDG